DGSKVWPRVSPGGKPAVYRSVNGGRRGPRHATRPPKGQTRLTRQRQAKTPGGGGPAGVHFATTTGEGGARRAEGGAPRRIAASRDEGRTWRCIAAHLPHVYAVETA